MRLQDIRPVSYTHLNLNDTNILAIKLNNSESEILIKYQNRKKKLK